MRLYKRGQLSIQTIWMILAIIGLAAAVLMVIFFGDVISNYFAKAYNCLRYGGCFK